MSFEIPILTSSFDFELDSNLIAQNPLAQRDQSRLLVCDLGKTGMALEEKKFFEMADKMFATQNQWSTSKTAKQYFETLAKELKLDIAKFNKDRESQQVKDRVQSDVTSGTQVEVQATPSFYLDGKKIDNIGSFADFKKLLQDSAKN
jgi:protein-disulfide isomerase